jgi:hypothetical protein
MAERLIRVLCIHGVKRHPVGGAWEEEWSRAIEKGLRRVGTDVRAVPSFVHYDDLADAEDIDLWDCLEAVAKLLSSAVTAPFRRARGISDALRWTAGMVVKWVESERFRSRTRQRVVAQVESVRPDAILAHSLGSLVAYDAYTHPDTRDRLSGTVLVTLGSQIANPFVSGQFLGGRILVPESASHWYHLFNERDMVFTEPIRLPDERFTQVDTPFDADGPADHAAEEYLQHEAASRVLWWALANPDVRKRLSRRPRRALPDRVRRVETPRHRALLIGINDYPDPKDRLGGCVNDVFLVSSVLQEAGIEAENIRVVLDERATTQGIKDRIDWLLDELRPGDQRVLYYSGHGAQLPTYGPGERAERIKECLVPYDFDWSEEHAITDDWFQQLYAQLPYESEFLAAFDCCHSGGLTRAGLPRPRGLNPPDDVRHRALRWDSERDMWRDRELPSVLSRVPPRAAMPGADHSRDRLGHSMQLRSLSKPAYNRLRERLGHKGPYMPVLLYACRADELAYEYLHGSIPHGAFTFSFAKTLRRETRERRRHPTYRRLVDLVADDMRGLGYDQRPTAAGPRAKLDAPVPFLAGARRRGR